MRHNYQPTDYTKFIAPLPKPLQWLDPKVNDEENEVTAADEIDKTYDKTFDEMKTLSYDLQVEGVRSLIYSNLYEWTHDNDTWPYSLVTAVCLVEGLKLHECLDDLLEVVRQGKEMIEAFFMDEYGKKEVLVGVLCQTITPDDLPLLMDFIQEPGLSEYSRQIIFTAVSSLPSKAPSSKRVVKAWINQLKGTGINISKSYTNDLLEDYENSGEYLFRISEASLMSGDDDHDYDERQEYHPFAIVSSAEYKPAIDLKKYVLRVSLRAPEPAPWRELEVPSSLKLTSLAGLIIVAMGWNEDHLHQFITRDLKLYATSLNEINSGMSSETLDGSEYCIGDLLKRKGGRIIFQYDYGDCWYHFVDLIQTSKYANNEQPAVHLLDGKMACPEEDSGGISGYINMCEAMKDPDSEEAQELIEWMGHIYDPEYFPLDKANNAIEKFNK